ncbi:basic blue protein-like [Macadamia integrifolia]|uniref:basic blue protein-like n=1 Tax=Macadamia integrifolia TaxID=60698 RepID=UPI001C4E4357|nr:basic blue protein-like [Macadamia integrifolia]
MAKLNVFFYVVAFLCLVLTCSATLYTVGGTSGWDVSTDLQSWAKSKTFYVGDVLLFLYTSSTYTVNEVTRNNFNGCNLARALQIYSGGNSSITLTKPGDRFFVCGNKLYCCGGMKLQVHTNGGQRAGSPASAPGLAPQASTSLTHHTNFNNASPNLFASDGSLHGGRDCDLVAACLVAVLITLI